MSRAFFFGRKLRRESGFPRSFQKEYPQQAPLLESPLAACRTKDVGNLFYFEQSEYSYRSQATFDSRYFVDISECFEKKVEAIKAY